MQASCFLLVCSYICNKISYFMQFGFLDKIKSVVKWVWQRKYLSATIVFLLIIILFDDNNLISHIRNNTVINGLNEEIREMEADSAEVQAKTRLYTNRDSSVMEDIAHEQGLKKVNEDIYIIVE